MNIALTVKRVKQGKNSTLSEIYLHHQFICYGLEDIPRPEKIAGSTCIPVGIYRLDFNKDGGMNGNYYDRFPSLHRGMIEIMDIPEFSLVYLHIGNTYRETAGCILVGNKFDYKNDEYSVLQSVLAYKKLYRMLVELMEVETVFLSIE